MNFFFYVAFYHSLALVREFSLETRDVRGFQIMQRKAAVPHEQ